MLEFIPQEVDLIFSQFDLLSGSVEVLLLLVGLLSLSLELSFQLFEGCLICQTLLSLSFERIAEVLQVAFKSVGLVLRLINNFQLFSQQKLKFLDQVLIGCAFSPLFFDLVLEELNLLVVHITFP